jgi:uncharacterized protein (TIGR03083 family)
VTLERAAILDGIHEELTQFGELIATLDDADLDRSTRCAGWTVGDVAGHVIGTAVDVVAGRVQGQGTAAVNERQARERTGRSPRQLADELDAATEKLTDLLAQIPVEVWHHPAVGNSSSSTGFAVEAIWYDAFVHGDDVRSALGLGSVRGPGLAYAVQHVVGYLAQQGRSLSLELDGIDPVEVSGGGQLIAGDPLLFVLVATGREDPAKLGVGPWINVYGS